MPTRLLRSSPGGFCAIASCFVTSFGAKFRWADVIVDFCCLSLKLVVELDGAGHDYEAQAKRDRKRDQELEEQGYRVLRFPNGIVLKAPTEFVKKVGECIAELEQSRLNELCR